MLNKFKSLGPGLLYAGAAIGVSHLVQSTKAGASYGYILIVAIVLAHVFKYPFFVLGPRYAKASGESLVEGFARQGKWASVLLLILTLGTMFTVQAAVTLVTAGLVQQFGIEASPAIISLAILGVCLAILFIGNFKVLDNLMKIIMIVLSISTLLAFALSFTVNTEVVTQAKVFNLFEKTDFKFLLSFVGWMPAPLDIAIWHSIWMLAKKGTSSGEFDFKVGFYGTAILGICFVVLGANTIYGTGVAIQSSAGGFAAQLIEAFTQCLGPWSYWLISIAAFTTMFSTTLTCFDAMPRVMARVSRQLNFPNGASSTATWRIVLFIGTMAILFFLVSNMKQMVTFATVLSFLTAPILAILSYRLVFLYEGKQLWSKTEIVLARLGTSVLILLSILYLFNF